MLSLKQRLQKLKIKYLVLLVTQKTDYHTRIREIESEIPCTAGLVKKTIMTQMLL